MADLPTGTVTFVFTDIEGSTRLAGSLGAGYADVLDDHRRLVREVVAEQGGREFGTEGDAFFLVFSSAPAAVRAAIGIQRRMAEGPPVVDGRPLRSRIGVHAGEGFLRDGDYVGLDVHRVARIAAAGHGGQILLSDAARTLAGDLPPGTNLRDLGEHRLKDITHPERIFQVDIHGLQTEFPPLRGVVGEEGNLPVQLTSFVGRERELEEVRRLLAGTRLLTLTGPGGTGKTRLSIQLAATVRPGFPGGTWFVPLSTIADAELVPFAMAEALGLTDSQGDTRPATERLFDHLRNRSMLLVLDNFEQIIGAADLVPTLLRAAPMVKVVVTSREALHVYGEREYQVPPLGLPDPAHLPDLAALPQYAAVALFIDRARAVRPGFQITEENAPAVAEICARLDGLPLAIELAAARIRLLSPDAILARMGDRLALLAGGSRDLPARQRTLREAIAWSYDLLDENEQRLFTRLSVFSSGCTLEEAEVVSRSGEELSIDVLDGVSSLAEKSLLRIRDDDSSASTAAGPRVAMLSTIREYARERLEQSGEGPEIRRRHAQAYLDLVERAAPTYTTAEGKLWLDRLEPEHDNLRAAIEWAIEAPEPPIALRLVAALWRFWQKRGHIREGRTWADRVLTMPGAVDHPRERARALEASGGLAYWQADEARVKQCYAEALQIAEGLGDRKLLADALYNYSFAFDSSAPQESLDRLRPAAERSMALYEELGDTAGVARARWALGNISFVWERWEEAAQLFDTSLEEARTAGDDFQTAWAIFMLASALKGIPNLGEANGRYKEALNLFRDAGDLTGILFSLGGMAELARQQAQEERAVRLKAATAALQSETGADLLESERNLGLFGNELESNLSDEETRRAWSEGLALTLEEAIAYALEESDPFAAATSVRSIDTGGGG